MEFSPNNNTVSGYIVEYGGMSGDNPINIQASKNIAISDIQVFTVTFDRQGGTGGDKEFTHIIADLTVTATYSINSYSLTVNYSMNDGSSAPGSYSGTVNYNANYSVSSPIVAGYTPDVATVSGTMAASDKTLAVTYTANTDTAYTDTAYTVEHYQENLDGSYSLVGTDTDNLAGTTNTTATASAKTYTGFSENITHTNRVASGKISGDGSLVLKLYYDRNQYTITYDSAGGSEVDPVTAKYGTTVTEPSNPTRSGYRFRGWYEDEGLTTAFVFDTLIVEDKTIYASWSRISSGSSSVSTTQDPSSTIVNVNGVPVSAGTETKTTEDGKTTTLVQVNNEVIQRNIDEAVNNTAETINPKDTFTYAEAATAIRNLLVVKGLINE